MASLALTDARLLIAGRDLSGQMNALALEYGAEMLDASTFGVGTRVNAGGLKSVVANAQGLWDASTVNAPDPAIFDNIGVADIPVIIAPSPAVGDRAYLFRAVHSEYTPGGQVGELLGFSVAMEGAGGLPLIGGALLHNGSATGNVTGTAVQLGAVSASQFVYAALQVMSGTGNFTVVVESASDQAFTVPNTRITFAQVGTATPVASEWASLAGAITDTWWRITAVNPNTRNFAVAVGIQ